MKKYKRLESTTLKWRNQKRNDMIYKDYIGYLKAGSDIDTIYMTLAKEYGLSFSSIRNIVSSERKAAGRTVEDDKRIARESNESK